MARVQIDLMGTNTRAGANWTVTSQWSFGSLPAAAAMPGILAAAYAALTASVPFNAGVASNYIRSGMRAIGYAGTAAPAVWSVDYAGSGGSGTGTALPIPLAVVVSEQTGVAGPSYRGRSYWPGVGGGALNTDGSVTNAQQAAVRSSWLALHTAIASALTGAGLSGTHCVYSRKLGFMTPITLIRTGNRVDTARGRYGDQRESYTNQALPATLLVDGVSGRIRDYDIDLLLVTGVTPEAWDAMSEGDKRGVLDEYNTKLRMGWTPQVNGGTVDLGPNGLLDIALD